MTAISSRIIAFADRRPKLLALALGAVSATGFAPLNLWPLTLLALAGWMLLVARSSKGWRSFGTGWAFGVGHFMLGLNWIATAFTYQAAMPAWLGWIAVVLLALYLAIYPALAAWGAWLVSTRVAPAKAGGAGGLSSADGLSPIAAPAFAGATLSFVLALAALWTLTEWLRSWVFTGFAWNPLVVTIGDFFGLLRLTGTYGGSATVILAAGYLLWVGQLRTARNAQTRHDPSPRSQLFQQLGAGAVIAGFLTLVYLAIPDYLETGYPAIYYDRSPAEARGRLTALMNPGDLMLLGALKLEFDRTGQAVGARNAVMTVHADGTLGPRYDKAHLVPYGEYLPMRPLLSAIGLSRLAPGDLDFWPGPGPHTLDLGAFGKAGLQICYEIIFSGEVVDRAHRPDFIFNPSNDAWFGAWGPPQHLAQARLRAIEEGLPVIRATPTGISAVIDADGRIVEALPMHAAGRIDAFIPKAHAPTLFARYGNMLPVGFALLLLALAIAFRRRGR